MNGWEAFERYLAHARARLGDQWQPVGLILLPAGSESPTGETLVYPGQDQAVLWEATVPIAERGPLLRRLAEGYARGHVLRTDSEGEPL